MAYWWALNLVSMKEDAEYCNISIKEFVALLMMRYTEPVKDENEHRATQLRFDYFRKTGIDGVAYRSFLTQEVRTIRYLTTTQVK